MTPAGGYGELLVIARRGLEKLKEREAGLGRVSLVLFACPFGYWPSDPASPLYRTRRKHCANALSCGAGLCRNPSAGLPVEGFLASEILYPSAVMSNFNERFGIPVDIDQEREKFIARVSNEIFDALPGGQMFYKGRIIQGEVEDYHTRVRPIVSFLGKQYQPSGSIHAKTKLTSYIDIEDFLEVLKTIEAIYATEHLWEYDTGGKRQGAVEKKVNSILAQSELDIGIRWQDGKFWPKGAELLDENLVNDPLKWLRTNGHSTVVKPFEKALHHFLEAGSRPEILSNVIEDAYKALEALAKIVLDNDRDISQNREKFVSEIKGKDFHKEILKQYIGYGNKYRHGSKPKSTRPQPSKAEAEFFLYFTGTFLRLAMENWGNA